MTTIYTCPDFNFDKGIKKILIRNADWEDAFIEELINSLDEKPVEIYIQSSKITDVQWAEGIRAAAVQTIDWRTIKDKDPITFIKELINDY